MTKHILSVVLLSTIGCAGDKRDDNWDPGPGPEEGWDHCPSADTYVGDESWEGTVYVDNSAVFCEYPVQHQEMDIALTKRGMLRVVGGAYPMPTSGSDLALSLPICLRDPNGPLPGVGPGIASAGVNEMLSGLTWWVAAEHSFSDGDGSLGMSLAEPGDVTESYVYGTEFFQRGLSFGARRGPDETNWSAYAACSFEPTTCDRFEMENGDRLTLDQYHWVGPVGSGFASITEARGQLDGTEFTVTNKENLFMSFGHHAFDRDGQVFFDSPIGDACGLYADEVTGATKIWVTDCDGAPIRQLAIVEEVHEYQQGPCP